MTYLIIIFIPPVYFLMRQDWLGFIVNSIFYGLAVLLLLSIIGAIFSPFPWAIAMGHASWALRKQIMEEQATIMAKKMAETFRRTQGPPPLP